MLDCKATRYKCKLYGFKDAGAIDKRFVTYIKLKAKATNSEEHNCSIQLKALSKRVIFGHMEPDTLKYLKIPDINNGSILSLVSNVVTVHNI